MTKQKRRILFWRILLGILIVCNMAVIFMFSAQSRSQSSALSTKITTAIVRIFSKDNTNQSANENKNDTDKNAATTNNKNENSGSTLTKEQQALVNKSHTPIRKLAHMLEFGSLATLSLLFLITWPGKLWWRYLVALGFTLIYAGTDEFHQLFIDGRGPQLSDVLVDFWGALIACTIALIIIAMVRQVQKMKRTGSTVKDVWCEFVEHVLQMFSCIKAFVTNQSATHKKEQTAEHNEENIA